jgi:hypothetical protein
VFRFRFDGSTVLGTMPGASEQTEMQFFVDDEPIAKSLGARLKPLHADLVDVAAAVHIADRQAKRPPDGELWRRRFASGDSSSVAEGSGNGRGLWKH